MFDIACNQIRVLLISFFHNYLVEHNILLIRKFYIKIRRININPVLIYCVNYVVDDFVCKLKLRS